MNTLFRDMSFQESCAMTRSFMIFPKDNKINMKSQVAYPQAKRKRSFYCQTNTQRKSQTNIYNKRNRRVVRRRCRCRLRCLGLIYDHP